MKLALLILALARTAPAAPAPMPDAAPIAPYDLALEFQASPGATGYWLQQNGVRFSQTVGTNAYITNLPYGNTTYTVTATNKFGESLPSNIVTATNPPPLTNVLVMIGDRIERRVSGTKTWGTLTNFTVLAATNPPGNPGFEYRSVMTFSKTNF